MAFRKEVILLRAQFPTDSFYITITEILEDEDEDEEDLDDDDAD